jgi:hypothetical protein
MSAELLCDSDDRRLNFATSAGVTDLTILTEGDGAT